ncbi:MAG: hypothetical protein U0746_04400 [Gemmataceae bacterium]
MFDLDAGIDDEVKLVVLIEQELAGAGVLVAEHFTIFTAASQIARTAVRQVCRAGLSSTASGAVAGLNNRGSHRWTTLP